MQWFDKFTNSLPSSMAKLVMPDSAYILSGKASIADLNRSFNKKNCEMAVVDEVNKRLFAGKLGLEDAQKLGRDVLNRCLHEASSWVQDDMMSRARNASYQVKYTSADVAKIYALSIFFRIKQSSNNLICAELLRNIVEDENKCFSPAEISTLTVQELLKYELPDEALKLTNEEKVSLEELKGNKPVWQERKKQWNIKLASIAEYYVNKGDLLTADRYLKEMDDDVEYAKVFTKYDHALRGKK